MLERGAIVGEMWKKKNVSDSWDPRENYLFPEEMAKKWVEKGGKLKGRYLHRSKRNGIIALLSQVPNRVVMAQTYSSQLSTQKEPFVFVFSEIVSRKSFIFLKKQK
jgi:hypothetical protein